jgi:hypothetical protein
MRVKTHYQLTPLPYRGFDWSAYDDETYEGNGPVGYGATEEQAIADLMDQLEDAEQCPEPR